MKRKTKEGRRSGGTIFSSRIKCGECGGWYGAKVWHSTDRYRRIVWQCNNKFKVKGHKCITPVVTEDEIKEAFIKTVNIIISEKKELIVNLREGLKGKKDTSELESRRDELCDEINIVAELMQKAITQNTCKAQDQEEYNKNFENLTARLEKAQMELQNVDEEIKQSGINYRKIKTFFKTIENLPNTFDKFDEALWSCLIDYVTVDKFGDMQFTTTSGLKV